MNHPLPELIFINMSYTDGSFFSSPPLPFYLLSLSLAVSYFKKRKEKKGKINLSPGLSVEDNNSQ